MSPNASVSPRVLNNKQEGRVDTEDIVTTVTIIILTITVLFGIVGNLLVIWVAKFKLKVR